MAGLGWRDRLAAAPGRSGLETKTGRADLLAPAPLPQQRPVTITAADGRHGAYLTAALTAEAGRVTAAAPGARNTALYRAAVALGQLVAGGAIDTDAVTGLLTEAAHAAGLDDAETGRTITSGLRAGAKRPRTLGGAEVAA